MKNELFKNLSGFAFMIIGYVGLIVLMTRVTMAEEQTVEQWMPVAGSPNDAVPIEKLSPCVDIQLTHEHMDDAPTVDYASGILLNRHVWPNRTIRNYDRITRDSLGQDETPEGTNLPIAMWPKKEGVPWGGEMLAEQGEKRSMHQRQWDYIEQHVQRALDYYITKESEIYPSYIDEGEGTYRKNGVWTPEKLANRREKLTPWQKFNAICNYASGFQCRVKGPYFSRHPVDVLHHGFHCAGTSSVFLTMFNVAGFEARNLSWRTHRSTEVKVGDKWIFADMMTKRAGGEYRSFHSWAEISAEPNLLMPAVLSFIRSPTARLTIYSFAPTFYWKGMGGISRYDKSFEINPSLGMPCLQYLPNTASALYPKMRTHIWPVAKGSKPTLEVAGAAPGIAARLPFKAGMTVRKIFYISDCRDNPIVEAQAKFYFSSSLNRSTLRYSLDGKVIDSAMVNGGIIQLAPKWLTPGEHTLTIEHLEGNAVELRFYPDVIRPYFNPIMNRKEDAKDLEWPQVDEEKE